jgi:hypothetical protein
MKAPVWLTDQQKADMAAMYAQGASLRRCAKSFNVDLSTAALWIPRQGVQMREAKVARRLYHCNESAFSSSSAEASYWLGFLLADGCIREQTKGSKNLCVALQENDRKHLIALRTFLRAEHPIRHNGKSNSVVLVVTSNQLCNDLIRKGCSPRKSLILLYPDSGYFYRRHFVRGYFDGDGSIFVNEAAYCQPTIKFVGTLDFLHGLQEVLITEVGLNKTSIYVHKHTPACYLAYTGRGNIRKLYEYLYAEPGPYLERKKAKFEYALSYGKK